MLDRPAFADALIFNYLIAGTDAHAKNYSLLFEGGNIVQLAPLYDIASALPYPHVYNPHKVRLAMKIGSEYPFKKIELRHWQTCGKQLRIAPDDLLERFQTLAGKIQQLAPAVADNLHTQGLTHPIIDVLAKLITQRSTDAVSRYFSG